MGDLSYQVREGGLIKRMKDGNERATCIDRRIEKGAILHSFHCIPYGGLICLGGNVASRDL